MKEYTCQKYLCPKHGEITSVMQVDFAATKGHYCMECWVDEMVKLGIPKVELIKE
jgi:hypothetical protein